MQENTYTGKLGELVERGKNGTVEDIDYLMNLLNNESSLSTTRFVDFALSLVEKPEGVQRIEYYLFNGTQIQRNYSSLFFNRRLD